MNDADGVPPMRVSQAQLHDKLRNGSFTVTISDLINIVADFHGLIMDLADNKENKEMAENNEQAIETNEVNIRNNAAAVAQLTRRVEELEGRRKKRPKSAMKKGGGGPPAAAAAPPAPPLMRDYILHDSKTSL